MAALDNKYRHSTLTSNGHGSAVVSALRFERSGPGFDSRNLIFLPRIKNRRIISSTSAATSTADNDNYHGQHIPPQYKIKTGNGGNISRFHGGKWDIINFGIDQAERARGSRD